MARSKNSRRGATNRHGLRHKHCADRHCPHCARNFKHAETKQRQKGKEV